MIKWIGIVEYTDRRTGESWGDREICFAESITKAIKELKQRIHIGLLNGQAELVNVFAA